MAWQRYRSIGFELNTVDEVNFITYNGILSAVLSTTQKKTGANSMRWQSNTNPAGVAFSALHTLVRTGFHIYHAGPSTLSGRRAIIAAFQTTPSFSGVLWHGDTNMMHIWLGGASVASVSLTTTPLNNVSVWTHIGIVYYAHSTNGYVSVYIDGDKVLTYIGDTGSGIPAMYLGGFHSSSAAWNNSMYVDDFYIDIDAAGVELDEPPPASQFAWAPVNGNGTSTQFAVTGAGSNYEAIDDATPDGDTTYVYADTAGMVDFYTLNVPTIPTGYKVTGVTMTVITKRTNTGVASTLDLGLRQMTDAFVTAQLPPSSYLPMQGHFKTQISTAVWSPAAVSAAEWGFRSSGSF